MEESMFCDENGKPFQRTSKFDMELYNKELEKQAEEYADGHKHILYNDCIVIDNDYSRQKQAFQDGAKREAKTICKKILEEVEKAGFVYFGSPTVNKLKEIIKGLGVTI